VDIDTIKNASGPSLSAFPPPSSSVISPNGSRLPAVQDSRLKRPKGPLKERKVAVGQILQVQGRGAQDPEASRVLWVGNVSPEVTEEQLVKEFSAHGKVESARILRQRFCAFVNFEDVESATNAKEALNGEILGGQYIVINYRRPTETRAPMQASAFPSFPSPSNIPQSPSILPPLAAPLSIPPAFRGSRSLWVGNIAPTVSEQELQQAFEQY